MASQLQLLINISLAHATRYSESFQSNNLAVSFSTCTGQWSSFRLFSVLYWPKQVSGVGACTIRLTVPVAKTRLPGPAYAKKVGALRMQFARSQLATLGAILATA